MMLWFFRGHQHTTTHGWKYWIKIVLLLVATRLHYSVSAFVSSRFSNVQLGWGRSQLLRQNRQQSSELFLVPLSNFKNDMTFLSLPQPYRYSLDEDGRLIHNNTAEDDSKYILSLVEERDLADVAKFIIQIFGADVIALSANLTKFEKTLATPYAWLANSYSEAVAFAEVFSGLVDRTKDRVPNPDVLPPTFGENLKRHEKRKIALRNSVVLALAQQKAGAEAGCDIIASIELRLQPTDAKIPFTLPWVDEAERKLAYFLGKQDAEGGDANILEPYLSNLCVDKSYRGRKIGRALVRCVENLAQSWGYKRMYLHVELDNTSAFTLYQSEGYVDVGRRWAPFWAGKAAKIGYFVKQLE